MRDRQVTARATRITAVAGATGLIACLTASPIETTGASAALGSTSAETVGTAQVEAPPDAVLRWNEIMVESLAGQNPFAAGRLAAITHVAVFEAINSITQEYNAYAASVPAPVGASAEAAGVAAAHRVLAHYLSAQASDIWPPTVRPPSTRSRRGHRRSMALPSARRRLRR